MEAGLTTLDPAFRMSKWRRYLCRRRRCSLAMSLFSLEQFLESHLAATKGVASAGCGFTGQYANVGCAGTALREKTASGWKVFWGYGTPGDCRSVAQDVSTAPDAENGMDWGRSSDELSVFIWKRQKDEGKSLIMIFKLSFPNWFLWCELQYQITLLFVFRYILIIKPGHT